VKGIGADGEYWAALAQGKLKMQCCTGCGRWHWPAVWRCGECGGWDQAWHDVQPSGRIYSWTRTWHDFGAPRDLPVPYVSVLVELDGAGGNRLLGTLDPTVAQPAIGMRVTAQPRCDEFEGAPLLSLRWSLSDSTPAASVEGA